MTLAHSASVAEILREHVTPDVEGIDRMYLNAVVPLLQSEGGIAWFFREYRGKGYSLRSSDRYALWLAPRRERRPRPVARKSASVSIWGVRTACVTSR